MKCIVLISFEVRSGLESEAISLRILGLK
ncbi:hypothetical protein SMJ63A_140049 [Stenotrophomonas geniculata]